MAIALRASSTLAYGAARTTSSVPVPTGVAAGDVIIVTLYTEDAAPAVTPPTGFTELTFTPAPVTATNGVQRQRVFWKRASAADTGSYAFTHTSCTTEGAATAFSGALASGTPAEVLGSAVLDATTAAAPPAVSGTTTQANEYLFYGATCYTFSATSGAPTGFTVASNAGNGIFTAYKAQATAGATGSVQATGSGGLSNWTATLIGIFPASTSATASAGLTGSGTLTATVTPRATAPASLSGAGTTTTTVQPLSRATAAATGSGQLSTTLTPRATLTAALSGSGVLTATTTPRATASAALSGAGALTATAGAGVSTAAALSGSGTLTATVAVLAGPATATAALSGAGQLSAEARAARYVFRTPTDERGFRMAGRGLFASANWARSVLRIGGSWLAVTRPNAAQVAAADRYFPGGYAHYPSDSERAELVDAGFGSLITVEEIT